MSTEALNLEKICEAIDSHAARCPFPATAVLLSPFDAEKLGLGQPPRAAERARRRGGRGGSQRRGSQWASGCTLSSATIAEKTHRVDPATV